MGFEFNDKNIVCPFYQKENKTKIHCEGIDQHSLIQLYFVTKQFQLLHEEKYCMNINNYTKCPLYSVIARQYEKEKII